jgi:hypothetical protein
MMITETMPSTAQVLGIAPQFLVDNLNTAIAYYRDKLGFDLDFCYESFYASVSRNGFAIHLKYKLQVADISGRMPQAFAYGECYRRLLDAPSREDTLIRTASQSPISSQTSILKRVVQC